MKNINKKLKIGLLVSIVTATIIGTTLLFWNTYNNPERLKVLYNTENEFGSVWVYEQYNERCMTFRKPPTSVLQSCMLLTKPDFLLFGYTKAFMSTLFLKEYPRKILMIGLGGASIPKALNKLVPHAELDAVEINPALIPVNREYFNFTEGVKNKIFVEDGFDFVKNAPSNSYDIVLVDGYDAEYIAPQLLSDEFFKNIKRITTKNGIVAVNTFQGSKSTDLESKLITDNFGKYYNLIIDNSRVIVTSKSDLPSFETIYVQSKPWVFRFGAVGINQHNIASLYKDSLKQ